RNVVDPDDIIAGYGADTARWFMLSDSPPDRDVIWTEAGVEGAHRFVQRIWRLVNDVASHSASSSDGGNGEELLRAAHRTLDKVDAMIADLRFNTAVAQLYTLVNTLEDAVRKLRTGSDVKTLPGLHDAVAMLVQMFAPMMPHLAEECWKVLGHQGSVAEAAWPTADPGLVSENEITLPVQVNGKKRADLVVPADATREAIVAATLELDVIRNVLAGKDPKRVIVVPGRIVNVVV
ncbi:MAG: class I tRNA ligase family protein, partial [Nitratireductor sp.]|nr:class I tRNA ligase family protein [Nitratireductor sp.]